MKRLAVVLLGLCALALVAPSAYAQGAERAASGASGVAIPAAFSAAFSMALAAFGCGLAQSRVAGNAVEGMARNPGAADSIRGGMILGLVFIETLALFTLVIIFSKV